MKKLYALLALMAVSTPVYAIPVVEGASVIGSMVGVISSLIAGLIPSISKNARALGITVFIGLICLGHLAYSYMMYQEDAAINEFAYYSTEHMPSRGEAFRRAKLESPNFEHKHSVFSAEMLDRFVDLEDLHLSDDKYLPVFTGVSKGGSSDRPVAFAEQGIGPTDVDALVKLAEGTDRDILLLSTQRYHLNYLAFEMFERTGKKPFVSLIGAFLDTSMLSLEDLRSDKAKWTPADEGIYSVNGIDIRDNIREENTLENAINVSSIDLMMMTDKQIYEMFAANQNPVFITYHENDYLQVEKRLARLDLSYTFMDGGLKALYDDKLTLVPMHLNLGRELAPLDVMKDYSQSSDLKFICIEKTHCANNLPGDDTYYYSIHEQGRDYVKQSIQSLPDHYRYITVSSNLETYTNALLVGWWLNQSDKTYLGMFSESAKFSLNYIYVDFMEMGPETLDEYQAQFEDVTSLTYELKSLLDGKWVAGFLILGVLFRLALFPLQLWVSKGYYFQVSNLKVAVGSIGIFVALIIAYQTLNGLILDHGIVSHLEITQFSSFTKAGLALVFTMMICFQVGISFPRSKKLAYAITLAIVIIYAAGMITHIVTPLLLFLLGSELIAILMQLPYYLRYKREDNSGIYESDFKIDERVLPEKWKLVNQFNRSEGFLASRKAKHEVLLERTYALREKHGYNIQYIVRSCSTSENEMRLGGYYHSQVCDAVDLFIYVQAGLKTMDFVWVQPYYETKYNGVMTSVATDMKHIHLAYGKGDSATEGSMECQYALIDRNMGSAEHQAAISLLKRVERHFKSPVQIELGLLESGEAVLYQVRLFDPQTRESQKFYKNALSNFVLHESYLAKSTRLTGSVLEKMSDGDIVFANGFNYLSKNARLRKLFLSKSNLESIESALAELHDRCRQKNNVLQLTDNIRSIESIYKRIYASTQSKFGVKNYVSDIDYSAFGSIDGNDLEIFSDRISLTTLKRVDACSYDRRDAVHNFIIWANALMFDQLWNYCSLLKIDIDEASYFTVDILLNTHPEAFPYIPHYDSSSALNAQREESKVIVHGELTGKVVNAETVDYEDDIFKDGKVILAAEEIGSGWVRDLDKVSGLVSVYGHSSSHLAISADALGIPYRLVSSQELHEIIQKGHL